MKGIESVMRGYAEGGAVNPFQAYAGAPTYNPFDYLGMAAQYAPRPPVQIRTPGTPNPLATESGGYQDIYGNLEAIKAAQAAKKAAEAAAKIVPEPPSGQGTSAGDAAGNPSPSTAGGTATTNSFSHFAGSALSAISPIGAALSILGQMALNPDKQPVSPSFIDLARAAVDRYRGLPEKQLTTDEAVEAGLVAAADRDKATRAADQETMARDIAESGSVGGPAGYGGGAQAAAEQGGYEGSGMYARGGYVPGGSGGMDDDVPAIIDGKQPAKLSSGEFVFDAATVAALGDGNNAAGAKKLDGLRKAIRQKAYGHERQPPKNYSVGDLVRMHDRRG